ncbi:MAG: undecaprenyldiphospho-muramoylpentapeptide beta-N-acetylglucosaminyltransferase [Coriobacteriia bacterium]|nr:undecaprenyldiphospho-muramoylpentapeptide beta-N-acetylglucosaminyltransferase [Coriobacteriia bacterium]
MMSGGGTAGHIYPALTVAEELRAEGRDEVLFVGTPDGLEARLVPEAGISFIGIPAKGFDRSRPLSLVGALLQLFASTLRAVRILRTEKIDVVAGFGGYVSLPVGIAAVLTQTPLALHEQNSVPGLANKVLSRWAQSVAVTYEASRAYLRHPDRVTWTGNPVRESVLRADALQGRLDLGVPYDAPLLLVFGGSRGARHLNQVVVAARDEWLSVPGSAVVHIAGRDECASVSEALEALGGDADGRYRVLDYVDGMGSLMAAADLVVARAGATSIAEMTCLGKASVLVPYPYATDDHQTLNAKALQDAGAALVFADSQIDRPEFVEKVTELLTDGGTRATMAAASSALGRPDAALRVADTIRGVCR